MVLKERKTAKGFSAEKPFVSLRLLRSRSNKLATASLNDSNLPYTVTINLSVAYPEAQTNGAFDPEKALRLFDVDYPTGGVVDGVCGYDIPVADCNSEGVVAVKIAGQPEDRKPMQTFRIASWGSQEDALQLCKRNYLRQVKKGTFVPLTADQMPD